MVYGGMDAYAHKNAYTMSATDLSACRQICQDRGYGAFTVWSGQAFFRSEPSRMVKDNMKRAAGTTMYVNLETEQQRKARLKAEGKEDPVAPKKKPAPAKPPPQGRGDDADREPRAEARWEERPQLPKKAQPREPRRNPKLRSPGSYVLPVFAQHDRSNHAERQALIKVIARVQEACDAQTDEEFEAECAEVTGTVRLYASHTPCISCMACFCQFQRLFPKVKLCVDFDDWRDTRRMVEMARREEEYKRRGVLAPTYDCAGLSDMSDEEDFPDEPPPAVPAPQASGAPAAAL